MPAAPDAPRVERLWSNTGPAGQLRPEPGETSRVALLRGLTPPLAAERLAEAIDLTPGANILAVGAGKEDVALAFARRGHSVTAPAIAAPGSTLKGRAPLEGPDRLDRAAVLVELPFETGAFDVVVSLFEMGLVADADVPATELLRVCRRGGHIGVTRWPKLSFPRQVWALACRAEGRIADDGATDCWTDEAWVERHVFRAALAIQIAERRAVVRARCPDEVIGVHRRGASHAQELAALVAAMNTATDGSLRVPVTYTELLISLS